MEYMSATLIFALLFFLIAVAISRWIFRVNDIVKNLEELNNKMGNFLKNVPN